MSIQHTRDRLRKVHATAGDVLPSPHNNARSIPIRHRRPRNNTTTAVAWRTALMCHRGSINGACLFLESRGWNKWLRAPFATTPPRRSPNPSFLPASLTSPQPASLTLAISCSQNTALALLAAGAAPGPLGTGPPQNSRPRRLRPPRTDGAHTALSRCCQTRQEPIHARCEDSRCQMQVVV